MSVSESLDRLKASLESSVIGQERLINRMLIALLVDGHLLVEGAPGLAKTRAIKALSDNIAADYQRVQFTPDLLPADLTGTEVYRPADGSFVFQQGPLFNNLVLADEINRAPAKVQSALLEAMAEQQISVGHQTYELPPLFMVMATQNPLEQEGTYPLPEAELDRFMLKILIDYPHESEELEMLRTLSGKRNVGLNLNGIRPIIKDKHIASLQKIAQSITVDDTVLAYITRLVRSTRQWPGIERGAGPRASIALLSASRALALLNKSTFVTPDEVKEIFVAALRHRILLSAELEIEGIDPDKVLQDILHDVQTPRN